MVDYLKFNKYNLPYPQSKEEITWSCQSIQKSVCKIQNWFMIKKKKAPLCKLGIEENFLGLIRQIYQKNLYLILHLKVESNAFSPKIGNKKRMSGLIACIQYSTEIYSHCNRARNVNVKYCKVCEGIGSPIHCWWEHQIMQPL